MKSIHAINQEIRQHQSQARESFKQSRVTDHLVMQQAFCELDKSAALKDYESRAWPVRQYRNWFADGAARREEALLRGAAQQTLRSLAQADVATLAAAKSAIKSDTQCAQSSYFQRVAHITESEITRIARDQFFINKLDLEARAEFVAAYDALAADLDGLPQQTDEALATLTERLEQLAQLDKDNRPEMLSQLGGTLAQKSAEIHFLLQSLAMAYGCASACLAHMATASQAALSDMRGDVARVQTQLESGSWHPSLPALAPEAWAAPLADCNAVEDEMCSCLTPERRQALVADAAFVLSQVQTELDGVLSAETRRHAAGNMHRTRISRAEIEMCLRDAVNRLGELVPAPVGQDLDTWLAEASFADLPAHHRRVQRALVDTIVLNRVQCIGFEADALVLPGVLDPVGPKLLPEARGVLDAIASLRQTPMHRVAHVTVALDEMDAKLLKIAARAATSGIQMQLQQLVPDDVAADCRWVDQALLRSCAGVKSFLGDFIDTEWDMRIHYMRWAQKPQNLEDIVIHGISYVHELSQASPELQALAQARYDEALAKHMQHHPEDAAQRDTLIQRYR